MAESRDGPASFSTPKIKFKIPKFEKVTYKLGLAKQDLLGLGAKS
jgi:hypothetical protein